ncbi:MAG: hypothetical protein WCX65_02955 [bacterium]
MKSALEIALENTKDIVAQDDPNALSKEAKKTIRDINKEYNARVAEIEVRMSSKVREMQGQYSQQELQEVLPSLLDQFRVEKDRINAERKEKVDAEIEKDASGKEKV